MDFVRRNLFYLICVVVAGGAVALGVTGLKRMPAVGQEMRNVESIYHNLTSLKPISLDGLETQRQRIETLVNDRREVFSKAKELYGYEPLVSNALPDGDAIVGNEFRRRYKESMQVLFDKLKSGTPPSARDIMDSRNVIENEKAAEQDRRLERGAMALQEGASEPQRTPGGVLTKAGARYMPEVRAAMARAQRAFCYAVHFTDRTMAQIPSLEFSSAMDDATNLEAPELEDIWYAQVGYWIQKDVVDAIVFVNEEAEGELKKKGDRAWIGTLPIKDLISVRVLEGFVPLDGDEIYGNTPDMPDAALPPGTPETVFTHTGSTNWYEVVQFSVKLVMDVRDIPRLVEKLTSEKFHTLLRVSYVEVPPNRNVRGKIYGSDPTVKVVMDFETVLLGEVFRQFMPESICDYFGINCPQREDQGD